MVIDEFIMLRILALKQDDGYPSDKASPRRCHFYTKLFCAKRLMFSRDLANDADGIDREQTGKVDKFDDV